MSNISFVRTKEEIENTHRLDPQYHHSEGLFMSWETDRELFRRVLPIGLEMEDPVVVAMVINHNHPGFKGKPYAVGMIAMNCHYRDAYGAYPIGFIGQVPDNDDMTIFYGREQYGYPKKTGTVKLKRNGDMVTASVTRHNVEVLKAQAQISDKTLPDAERFFPAPQLETAMLGAEFHMKYNRECFGNTRNPYESMVYDDPKLVHTQVETIIHKEERAVAEVQFGVSVDDPWIELAPKDGRVNAIFRDFDCSLMSNVLDKKYIGEEAEQILPYLFTNSDYKIFAE